ncbi:hypothetical protein [Paenibacillus caui]|nr:hypothetical protein [Paenibacillus caui]
MVRIDDLWDYDHPGETERKIVKLLEEYEPAGDTGYIAELLTLRR